MNDPSFFFSALGTAFVIACGALIVFAQHSKRRARLRTREMVHRERMAALEHGLPVPELALDQILESQAEPRAPIAYIRFVSLVLGLLLASIGTGVVVAFPFIGEDDWQVGIIPILMGGGLLLSFRLTRNWNDD